MSITLITEEVQSNYLATYNQGKAVREKIPLVQRNLNSGWPLLQVSLFTPNDVNSKEVEYVPALGGGKCHYVDLAAFTFAELLIRIPGKIVASSGYGNVLKEKFNANNIGNFLDGFRFKHNALKITINSTIGPYGKILEISFPVGDSTKLKNVLCDAYDFAFAKGGYVTNFGTYKQDKAYPSAHIQKMLDNENAIFLNGQIFIDIGRFLDEKVKDEEIKEFLQGIFKVNEFLELANSINLIPQEVILREADIRRLKKFCENKLTSNENNIFGSDYNDSIENFRTEAIKIRQSDNLSIQEQKQQLKQLAHNLFQHRDYGKRLLADVLQVISVLGLAVGLCRLAIGKTFFFSTAMTSREKDFTEDYLNSSTQKKLDL